LFEALASLVSGGRLAIFRIDSFQQGNCFVLVIQLKIEIAKVDRSPAPSFRRQFMLEDFLIFQSCGEEIVQVLLVNLCNP